MKNTNKNEVFTNNKRYTRINCVAEKYSNINPFKCEVN